jgi:hypothetical protein
MESKETPFYQLTRSLLDSVNTLDYDGLRRMVDDEFGIVDVDPEGKSIVIDDMDAWERYMRVNMEAMRDAEAELSSEILDYRESATTDMAFSVVRFRQDVGLGSQTISNFCLATIIWKRQNGSWKEARWHCSLLKKTAR